MLTKRMLLGVSVLLLAAAALWWSVDKRSESGVSFLPLRREVEESLKNRPRDDYGALRREIFENFRKAADYLNENSPMPAGPNLQLKRTEASRDGPSMTYTYVVDGEIRVGLESMDPVMREVCSKPEMSDYMQYGVFYRYVYENAEGKVLMSFEVDEQTCKALGPAPKPALGKTPGSTPMPASAPLDTMQAPPVQTDGPARSVTDNAPAADGGAPVQTAPTEDAGGEEGESAPAGELAIPQEEAPAGKGRQQRFF